MISQAREGEERGHGIPFTEAERARQHFEQYGSWNTPPRGTGLGFELPAIRVLKNLANPSNIGSIGALSGTQKAGLIGLFLGGFAGWFIAKKWPGFVVKWVGVAAGANIGVVIAEFLHSGAVIQRR